MRLRRCLEHPLENGVSAPPGFFVAHRNSLLEGPVAKTKPTIVFPKFKFSLTEKQTLELGRLSVTWGQIDHFVFSSVSMLLARDLDAGTSLMGKTTTGPLVNLLNKSRHRIADKEIRDITKKFCSDMGPLIVTRNHIMHGIWGFYLPGKNPAKSKPGCLYMINPKNPVFPEKITTTANKAAKQTYAISRVWYHLAGESFPKGQPSYYFSQHQPRVPKGTKLKPVGQPPKDYQS